MPDRPVSRPRMPGRYALLVVGLWVLAAAVANVAVDHPFQLRHSHIGDGRGQHPQPHHQQRVPAGQPPEDARPVRQA
ncbi:hypothetical protein MAHJHV55_54680 [Mycobacterium avium subsp. hominissuis]